MVHRRAKGVIDAIAEAVRAGAVDGFWPVAALLDRVFMARTPALSGAAVAALGLVALGALGSGSLLLALLVG